MNKTSIIILTLNAKLFTIKCIESIYKHTDQSEFELIIVDNGSRDGTKNYLEEVKENHKNVQLIFNKDNRGFSAANNQGARIATGKYLLFLNNDVTVAENWLTSLVASIEKDPQIGLVGPITNYISGRQMVKRLPYRGDKFQEFANKIRIVNKGKLTPRNRLAGFAIIARKNEYFMVGGFDETLGTGNYEDDDLCIRYRNKGFSLMCDESVFIHHYGSRTFMENNIDYKQSLKETKEKFKQKWPNIDYDKFMEKSEQLVDRNKKRCQMSLKYLRDHKLNDAKNLLYSVLLTNPIDQMALLILSIVYRASGKTAHALECVKKILRLDPQNGGAYHQMAMIVQATGDEQKAASLFTMADRRDPTYKEKYADIFQTG